MSETETPTVVEKPANLEKAWVKFDSANWLTDSELTALITSSKQGIDFLFNRGEHGGVLFKAHLDLSKLLDIEFERKRHVLCT